MAGSHRELLEYVEGVTLGNIQVDESQFAARLNDAKPTFINLLRYKVSPASVGGRTKSDGHQ